MTRKLAIGEGFSPSGINLDMSRIRLCRDDERDRIFTIVNEAAQAYRETIPSDCWNEPYMPLEELEHEIADGVRFWGHEVDGELVGVMGIQTMPDRPLFAGVEGCSSETAVALCVSAEDLFAARSCATREGGVQSSHFGCSNPPAAETASADMMSKTGSDRKTE